MKYCENCKSLGDADRCRTCGNVEMRDVRDDDFCFLLSSDENSAKMLEYALEEAKIKCAMVSFGNGARSALGLNLGNYKVYVPYKTYEEAKDIVNSFIYDSTSDLRENLLKNRKLWHVKSNFSLRKLRRKLKLAKNDDPFDRIEQAVSCATSISDGGPISSCTEGGRYISVKIEDKTFWFNSVTYEIYP